MDPEILDSQAISMQHCSGHFAACSGTSVRHGNQREVTQDKWMLINWIPDGNYQQF